MFERQKVYANNRCYAGLIIFFVFTFIIACDNSQSTDYAPEYGEKSEGEVTHYVMRSPFAQPATPA